ncbi:hypothetical protein GCM10011348_04050 [Marinobacterium nitratireducens]|uniref:Uncharacterized protein n=1 Tax=Marinobacterium nitratireducens TaxID=518897 RepID=A0A918DN90_9GAMM|nr:hypothetical protein GCM10011348_04050 [Marinobacterium nitratireducens]
MPKVRNDAECCWVALRSTQPTVRANVGWVQARRAETQHPRPGMLEVKNA